MDTRVYIDTEFMYDDMWHEHRMPKDTDIKEIIQIAAVLFDNKAGVELDHLNILVQPPSLKKLPPFFTELTGIDQETLDKSAVSFKKSYEKLVLFCNKYPIWTFNNDYHVIEQNCKLYDIENVLPPFIRVKEKLPLWGIDKNLYSSGTLYKAAGIQMEGHVHYALHDVRSMSQAVYKFEHNTIS